METRTPVNHVEDVTGDFPDGLRPANKKPTIFSRRFVVAGFLVSYLIGIFLLSSIRGTKVPLGSWVLFKVKVTNILHVPVFAILFLLIFMVLRAWTSMSRKWGCIVALLATSVLGVVIELYQAGVPGRAASLADVMLNLIGVGFGLLVFWLAGYVR